MNSKTLTTEIKALEEKRARLQSELETAQGAHTEARAGLVQTADKRTVDTVTTAHSRMAALHEAVSTLDSQLEEKRLKLKETEAQEKHQATLDKIDEIRLERDEARLAYLAARERANEALRRPLNEMKAAKQRWSNLGAEEDRLSVLVGSTARAASRFSSPPVEIFGMQVDEAFSVLGRLQERANRKQHSQELAEQRRARSRAA